MGVLGALSTAVSGLSAQSYALENISGNIANSQTVGFKRVDTSFVDLIPDSPSRQQVSGSVVGYSQLTNTLQGTLQSTGVDTNMALSGDGYFVVGQNTGSTSQPTFSPENLYTRRGDFQADANGYLVNGSGYFLSGTSYNPANGSAVGSSNAPLQISNAALPAKPTTEIDYSGNLPATPEPANYSATTSGSELLNPADFTTDPTIAGTGTVTGDDQATFLKESISGGQTTVYNSSGTATTAQLQWAKTASATAGGSDTWQLFYQTNPDATGTQVAWKNAGSSLTFDASGQLTSPSSITLTGLSANGTSIGDVAVNFGGGLTQYGDSNGTATPAVTQNGFTSGTLSSIGVSSDGSITGNYSNGQTAKLAQVTIAHFAANDALQRENGGAFSATTGSGSPTYGLEGSALTGGSVEQSNTDISDEFSKMIVTQQAYSANTKVMSTAQQMLEDVINVIR